VKGVSDAKKHPKMRALIRCAGGELIRRRFTDAAGLLPAVYASLVTYLEEHKLILNGPFDAAPCKSATLKDLNAAGMRAFVRDARASRGFPLKETASIASVLTHLNLLEEGKPTHAAVLLFGHEPQRFLPSSEIKCAHFHGTEVAKPIPSYQVYRGTVFSLVDQAVDFVMSKLALRVGTRGRSAKAPVTYEIPREVVAEGIVNAIAHRDYASNASVQVMLFADRLEVWNPGGLPSSLTLARLRGPHGSVPHNPLLAEPLYLTQYIERMGTGTGDMIRRCRESGLKGPQFRIEDGFVLTVWRSKGVDSKVDKTKMSGEMSGEMLSIWERKALQLIKTKPDITIPEMAKRLKRTERTVERLLNKLKADEIIGRVGPRKGGYWEVLK